MTTYAACLTPRGAAAIAVIAVRGPQAWEVVGELFHPRSAASGGRQPPECAAEVAQASLRGLTPPARLSGLQAGRFHLGNFGEDAVDEVVRSVQRVEPAPWLELHCHGGPEVVRMVLDALQCRGIEICSWQELLRRTEDSPLRVQALTALTQARTVRTAAVLLDQVNGAFETAVRAILADLDHGHSVEAHNRVQELTQYVAVGRHLTLPWRVVVAGAPNVGKSSLVNALAGYQRCVVAPTPGTTRDVVSAEIAVDGWPVELLDTAGLRSGVESLEEQGIHLARDAAATADLCLWVLDGSAAPVRPEQPVPNLRFVINKSDLPAAWARGEAADALAVSAQTGDGIAELAAALGRWLVPQPPPAGIAVPFTPRLCEPLAAGEQALAAGRVAEARQHLEAVAAAYP